jgi:beta-N-acetylhexosaminidase
VRSVALAALFLLSACASSTTGQGTGIKQGQGNLDGVGHKSPTTGAPYMLPKHWNPSHPLSLYDVADAYMARMSLDEELGQLILVALSGTDYNADNANMIEKQHAGGILLYSVNMTKVDQTKRLIATAQAHATIPLFVFTDEEGGFVDRLQQFYGMRPSATEIGMKGSADYAMAQGAKTGNDMRVLGFNADFAPDVDVQLVAGPDQLSRTFGTTPEAVTKLAGAYMNGMQSQGIITCLKHFPGLGAAKTDAHRNLPTINRTRDQIESVELAPYRNLIATGQVGMIMATDLLMPALDPNNAAEISPAIINGVLRTELGYDGVVVTDALYMDGIAKQYTLAQAGVLSILAGDDLLVGPFSSAAVGWMIQALKGALSQHKLTKARIDQSVRRILALKIRTGMLPIPAVMAQGLVQIAPLGSLTPAVAGPLDANKP